MAGMSPNFSSGEGGDEEGARGRGMRREREKNHTRLRDSRTSTKGCHPAPPTPGLSSSCKGRERRQKKTCEHSLQQSRAIFALSIKSSSLTRLPGWSPATLSQFFGRGIRGRQTGTTLLSVHACVLLPRTEIGDMSSSVGPRPRLAGLLQLGKIRIRLRRAKPNQPLSSHGKTNFFTWEEDMSRWLAPR